MYERVVMAAGKRASYPCPAIITRTRNVFLRAERVIGGQRVFSPGHREKGQNNDRE